MFARGRRGGRHAASPDRSGRSQQRRSLADELAVSDDLTEPDRPVSGEPDAAASGSAQVGPYDISEAPTGVARLDLGSLKIPSVPGVEVRVQANQEGRVQQVYLLHQDSVLQLGAFAAPRSESIWDEVRDEIRKQLFNDGVAAEEVPGDYGTELRARVRTPQGLRDLRFLGISGPRWLIRAVFQGPAAVDPSRAAPLLECLRQVVVERDGEARPVKEPLPLRLSAELAAQIAQQRAATGGQAPPPAGQSAGHPAAQPTGLRPTPHATGANGAVPAPVSPPPGNSAGQATPRKRKPSPRPRRD